jgi:hypothetical protein
MGQNRSLALKALLLTLFVSATPQAKPEWFSPKVKAIGGGIATATCLIVAGIYHIERQKINKFLKRNPKFKKT